jgi:putative tryptophan/tyrosine transport system substrate-binding protein
MIGRRELVIALGGAALARPLAALGQVSPKRSLVAWLSGTSQTLSSTFVASFLQGMQELGYVEGRNLDMLYRFSEGLQDKLPAFAEEVVRHKPDVILAAAAITAVAAKNATSTIPIVCSALADAVHLGLVASEARPGGNVTGIEPYVAGLPAKQMEFARAIRPRAHKVGVLTNLADPKAPPQFEELKAAGRSLEVAVIGADANRPADIEGALQALASQAVDVVIVLQTSLLLNENRQIAASALAKKLPTVFGYREHVMSGGLISYGVDLRWCYHRGASFVDRILRGTPPGYLPVEFPTNLMLSINLHTAQMLGVEVPEALLATADELIK